MGDKQVTTDDPFTNKMNVNLNVLSASMKNRILGEMGCTEVVALDNEGWWVKPELLEEGLEPKNLISYVSQTTVLCFNTRASYDLLFLGPPGYYIGAKKDTRAGCGVPVILFL